MRIPASSMFVCTFPDYEENGDCFEVDARDARQAAVQASGLWEESADDFRVLRGEDTLRVQVEAGGAASVWEVLGVGGRYVAKAMEV